MLIRFVSSATIFALLAACGGGGPGPSRGDRARSAGEFLERRGTVADPGKVAATDFAFARAAREAGQWSAYGDYAAPGAMIDAPGGFVPVTGTMAPRADAPEAVSWAPNIVWSSCDGTLAVSSGRFQDADGKIGDYVTGWQLRAGGTYRWLYTTGVLDDPQPLARPVTETPAGEDVIVVDALYAIEGKAADCGARGDTPPAPPPALIADGSHHETTSSDDGTLRYRWEHEADGDRNVVVEYLRDGSWERVVDLALAGNRAR